MKRALLILLVVVLYVLHQDFWFWRAARPLLFGFLPPGIWYHACYTLAVCAVMWILIRQAWPAHLEAEAEAADPTSPYHRNLSPEAAPDDATKNRAAQPGGTSASEEGQAP